MASIAWHRSTRDSICQHIGVRLTELRERKQVTQQQVAMATGMHGPSVCQIENGKHMPSAERLWKLARYFGVSMDYFFEELK